ncbi:hypothetical protein, partial [Streptomyces abyssalis]
MGPDMYPGAARTRHQKRTAREHARTRHQKRTAREHARPRNQKRTGGAQRHPYESSSARVSS